MRRQWVNLNEQEQSVYRVSLAFLNGRLEEKETIDWALKLTAIDTGMRFALLDIIDSPATKPIAEPWLPAWRLIEESWNYPPLGDSSVDVYDVQHRIRSGDRSGALISKIIDLVALRLEIKPFSDFDLHFRRIPKRPKTVEDLFRASVTSGEIVDPTKLGLESESDRTFLLSLVQGLDSAVSKGLEIARRIGWGKLWQLGDLHRVYYVPESECRDDENEPDEYNRGIAPSVKLLHSVVSRLLDIESSAALEYVHRWKITDSPIHIRLWAALAADQRVASADEVAAWLTSVNDRIFWDLHQYPEVSLLRAKRFRDLEPHVQAALAERILKRPPRNQWPRKADRERVRTARTQWAARELRRIEIGGASLSSKDKTWLEGCSAKFPDVANMNRITDGFIVSTKARWGGAKPDRRFDLLEGEDRLKALEVALLAGRRGWDDDPAESAEEWIRQPGNIARVLADLETVADGGAGFVGVWERLGWTHAPKVEDGGDAGNRDISAESGRVLALLNKLPVDTIRLAIDGISNWLSTWEKQVVALPDGLTVWLKVWPIAVEVTNSKEVYEDQVRLDTVARSSNDQEPMDLDTLNAPAGKLVGVFLTACPDLRKNSHPFDVDGAPRRMREVIITAPGRSGLIARHRMIESLVYFLRASRDWTQEHLVSPLIADNQGAIPLWRAIVRRPLSRDVIEILGEEMVKRATDRRLGRETRRSLVFGLVIESLYSFHENREPVVPYSRIQQMIRSLEDEVRAYGAEAVQRFVRDVSAQQIAGREPVLAEQLLRSAAAPFLQHVWPQEHSLVTPGVSRALAELPATSGEAFAEAVGVIERFLVPFDCWSMNDYGLYGEEDGQPRLSWINDPTKAEALLRLLDRTVGTAEGSVIPHDLAAALDQIRSVAPKLTARQEYRRLATAARRA